MNLAAWLGIADPPGQPPDRRPAVLLDGSARHVEAIWPVVDAALRRRADYRLIIAVPEVEREAAQRRFSHERVVAKPALAGALRRKQDMALVIDASAKPETVSQAIDGLPRLREPDGGVLGSLAATLLPLLGARRIATMTALGEALGSPDTILCLGNGPTSEDPAVGAYADATLFRVNWTWRARGRMTLPAAVFTADPDLPPEGSKAVLIFPRASIGRLVLTQHLLALRPPPAGYLFADELSPAVADLRAPVIPTNGALMIAVAAALRPRRLAIAGMDLYRHPEGRYPGSDAVEGYARGHSAGCDLAAIGKALENFAGDVAILSPNLAAALKK
ncbi:hypothetical protein [Mesorhizobium sp. KR9-304]|uniref:hypothetical protein n=1 Tax=Mesorhizobium sp. KR9-304 TaxID=3156614 RepID=UPI0032B342D5